MARRRSGADARSSTRRGAQGQAANRRAQRAYRSAMRSDRPVTDSPTASKPAANARKRIMAGMRPTGKLHVGHLLGALRTFVDLSQRHDCYFELADLHALTTKF